MKVFVRVLASEQLPKFQAVHRGNITFQRFRKGPKTYIAIHFQRGGNGPREAIGLSEKSLIGVAEKLRDAELSERASAVPVSRIARPRMRQGVLFPSASRMQWRD